MFQYIVCKFKKLIFRCNLHVCQSIQAMGWWQVPPGPLKSIKFSNNEITFQKITLKSGNSALSGCNKSARKQMVPAHPSYRLYGLSGTLMLFFEMLFHCCWI
jgi:hypothetical protein